jgi:hypothetical protein
MAWGLARLVWLGGARPFLTLPGLLAACLACQEMRRPAATGANSAAQRGRWRTQRSTPSPPPPCAARTSSALTSLWTWSTASRGSAPSLPSRCARGFAASRLHSCRPPVAWGTSRPAGQRGWLAPPCLVDGRLGCSPLPPGMPKLPLLTATSPPPLFHVCLRATWTRECSSALGT